MNQEMIDAVLKVLRENVHLNHYSQIEEIGGVFVAYDPYVIAVNTRCNAVRLLVTHENSPWSYHPRYVNEETAKMIALMIDKPLEQEENSIWNTGLVTLGRASYD